MASSGRLRRVPFVLAALLGLAVYAGCGGSGGGAPKRGGTLTVLATSDFQSLDPGSSYNQFDYMVQYATERTLFGWKPGTTGAPVPDLAAGPPHISNGGRRVTVKLRRGVRFSPPVGREVTSQDVRYALERAARPNVANGYWATYFSELVGADAFVAGHAPHIAGIHTPDPNTLVLDLARPTAATVWQALSLPVSAPVPREYASRFDSHDPSTYAKHVVATGPYMVSSYEPGKRAVLSRNPNWDAGTDWRPAYANEIEVSMGNDAGIASRSILAGSARISGDFSAPPAAIKSAGSRRRAQLGIAPGVGVLFASLNTRVKPLDDADVRRAIVAATDRNAMRLTRGGEQAGTIATHYLFPGMPGFDAAGGRAGPVVDFLRNPSGDLELAHAYMRKAGYPSGRYTGHAELLMVADNQGPAAKAAEVLQARLADLGFNVKLRTVTLEAMYSKFCGVPRARVAICPNLGWLKDFYDPQTVLDPMFNGAHIAPVNNSNYSELDDSQVNAAIARAETLLAPRARAAAWGEVDRMVTERAAGIPWLWINQINLRSSDVRGVVNRFTGSWDLAFTALK
ncbi:MAG: ABC transporter substrate-binding protein [Thermoleophilaceae bacterium]